MSKERTAVKLTMESGKVVIIKTPVSDDLENSMRMTGQQMNGSEDKMLYMFKMQDNLLKELLVSIDGDTEIRKPLDDLFNLAEKQYINKCVQKMTGLGNEMKVKEEIITL